MYVIIIKNAICCMTNKQISQKYQIWQNFKFLRQFFDDLIRICQVLNLLLGKV